MRALALRPEDIAEVEFSRSFRGYNEEEVREFLEEVATQVALLLEEKEKVLQENRELRRKLSEQEEYLRKMQLQLEEWKKQVEVEKELARRESQMIVKEAQLRAQKIVDEALERRREIETAYRGLFEKYRLFQIRFKSLLQTFIESIEKEGLSEEFRGEKREGSQEKDEAPEVVRFSLKDLHDEGRISK